MSRNQAICNKICLVFVLHSVSDRMRSRIKDTNQKNIIPDIIGQKKFASAILMPASPRKVASKKGNQIAQ